MKLSQKFAAGSATLTLLMLALTGCSSDSTNAAASTQEMSAPAQKALQTAYDGIGAKLALDPVTPKSGVNLYVVSCGESTPGCSTPAAGVVEAAEAIGWKATIADGKLSPEGFATAIRQSIAGGANVIVPIGISCGVAQAAFKEAVDAGITIIGGGGVDDCSPQLWGSARLWVDGYTPEKQWRAFGKLQADYLYGKTNGDVKAVVLNATGQPWGAWITDGFKEELTALGRGKVLDTIDVSDPEQADGSYLQKVTTALLNNPDANALVVPNDGWLVTGLSQAVVQTGKGSQMLVIGRGGDAAVLDMIRSGGAGVNATIGFATRWGSWGSVDTAARVLGKQSPAWIGEPMQAVDAGTNMVSSGDYMGGEDFKKIFTTAWGK
jgi:ribose transport system substrate-binding protein